MSHDPAQHVHVSRFMELFNEHHLAIYRYVFVLMPRIQDAEEVMQEVSKVLWEHFSKYEPGTNFLAWARRIAQLRVLEHRRNSARQPSFLPDEVLEKLAEDIESQQLLPAARTTALEQCIERLRLVDRDLIEQRYMQGASVGSLAATLERPANSISKSLERIRRTLLQCVERRLAQEHEAPQ